MSVITITQENNGVLWGKTDTEMKSSHRSSTESTDPRRNHIY